MAEEIDVEKCNFRKFRNPVTLTLTLDWVIWYTIVHQSSTFIYAPNFIEIGKTFCGQTDVRTHLLTNISDPSNVIRSTQRSRPKSLNFTKLSVCVRPTCNACGSGSILFWRQCNTLRTSGFVDDVILVFSHNRFCSVLFLSRPRSEGWPHHGRTFSIYLFLHLSLSSVILIDSSTESPVHDLILSIQAVRWSSSRAYTWHCST